MDSSDVGRSAGQGGDRRSPLRDRDGHTHRQDSHTPPRAGRRRHTPPRSGRRRAGFWILGVFGPSGRVLRDVLANAVQHGFVPDDVLVVVTLPHRCARRAAECVDAPGRCRFETRHYCTHRPWSGSRRGDPPVAPTRHTHAGGQRPLISARPAVALAANVGDCQDPVNMIRHDNPGIQLDFGTDSGGFQPFIRYYPACLVQHHLMIHDFPEQDSAVDRANGEKYAPTCE